MANSTWKTNNQSLGDKQVAWPSGSQLLKQLGLAVLIVALWAGLLVGYLRLTGGGQTDAALAEEEPQTVLSEITPAQTLPPPPTNPATSPLTQTPVNEAAETLSTSVASDEPTAEPPTAETLSTSVASDEPTAEPSTTETLSTPVASDEPTAEPPTAEPSAPATEPPQPTPPPADPPAPGDESVAVSFSQDVFPILEQRCIKCHGGTNDEGEQRIEEGLIMLTYEDLIAGSWNGPVIEPGDVEDSFLIEQIEKGEMPKKEPHLLPPQIRTIKAWVEAGAPNN